MNLLVARKGSVLVPAYDSDRREIMNLSAGEIIQIGIRKSRYLPHHRKVWAQMGLVSSNSDKWNSARNVLQATKLALGYYDIIMGFDGMPQVVPGSIAFENMNQHEFKEFHKSGLLLWAKELDCSVDDIQQNFMEHM